MGRICRVGRVSVAYSLYLLTGEEVVYLDPHTTQEAGSGIHKKSAAGEEEQEEGEIDASYHCPLAQRMPFLHLDPSLALVGTLRENTILCVFKGGITLTLQTRNWLNSLTKCSRNVEW